MSAVPLAAAGQSLPEETPAGLIRPAQGLPARKPGAESMELHGFTAGNFGPVSNPGAAHPGVAAGWRGELPTVGETLSQTRLRELLSEVQERIEEIVE